MKIRIAILFILIFIPSIALGESGCIEPLKVVSSDIDTAENKVITQFLLTFSKTDCEKNVEHSEWGNELIFTLMYKRSGHFFKSFFQLRENERNAIISEILSPVIDANWRMIVTSITKSSLSESEKNDALQLIRKAYNLDKDDQKVRVVEFDN